MFYLSKILSTFTQPLIWAAVLFLLALWWSRHPVAARCLLLVALGLTALLGWLPLPDGLLRQLENCNPAPMAARQLQTYTGVVLGGSVER